ncbi:MAG TPA: shikimate dehydrogenase [Pyrinomonadaceae bacterium]|jgi:3-dehydroquinate dehydratase/shikimate dehydrogenase|nr:shikimate dehydrogenase [Pyrinomonadaceae bacterium]
MGEDVRGRICVPVCVRTAAGLAGAVERAARAADIVELRLDCLEGGELFDARATLLELKRRVSRPFLYTLRPAEEGGRRRLTVDERVAFWESAAALVSGERPDFVDLELDLLESTHGPRLVAALEGFTVICSHHDFETTPDDLESLYERMARTPASVVKIAVRAREITDCVPLLRLLERARRKGREMIAVAMGEAGVLTRVLATARGAFLTYGSLDAGQATAPGQVTAAELRELYRVPELGAGALVTGLVGSPVGHSLSPHMHNAAFRALGLEAAYLPFEVANVNEFVRRMASPRTRELEWNLRGFSVTAPHKVGVMGLLDWVEERAAEVGAVNTVVIEGTELRGYNTDVDAALKPLRERLELRGARVAVMGAGGAARALLQGLRESGAGTTVFARDLRRGGELASRFSAEAAALEGASFADFDVVINTTPLGTSGEREGETPAAAPQLRGARVAYDLVYNPRETRFLREASEAGCETLGGLDMLVAQAAEQFRLWTGAEPPVGAMRDAAEKQLKVVG